MGIYDICADYVAFLEAVEAGDIPEEAIADTLDGMEGELRYKADHLACMVKNLTAQASAIKQEEQALYERRKSKERQAENLRNYIAGALQQVQISKLETARSVMSFRKSTSVYIPDEEDFKQRYADLCKSETKITIDKKEVANRLKAGEAIAGAMLQERQNLQIR